MLEKIRAAFSRFMSGRYGADQLGLAMVMAAFVITLLGSLTHFYLLTLLADVVLVLAFFRMLSKDRMKRAAENTLYLQKTEKVRRAVSEWMNRMMNRKKYLYFSCPKCKTRLRLPRGTGSVTITCRNCGNKFDKKA